MRNTVNTYKSLRNIFLTSSWVVDYPKILKMTLPSYKSSKNAPLSMEKKAILEV